MKELSCEQLNIAICEWRGWSVIFNESKGLHELLNPQDKWEHPFDADGDEAHCWSYAPNHILGVEALGNMHEAEKGLTEEDQVEFCLRLNEEVRRWKSVGDGLRTFDNIHASPRQRAIAILRVVRPELFK